jgi:NAD(P)-dependent dehydrogenase (short-subunit alcohol dehydrogenase family)
VVISGASRGLGRALALQYLDHGDEVWAGRRRPELVTELAARGANIVPLDVTDQLSIERSPAAPPQLRSIC